MTAVNQPNQSDAQPGVPAMAGEVEDSNVPF